MAKIARYVAKSPQFQSIFVKSTSLRTKVMADIESKAHVLLQLENVSHHFLASWRMYSENTTKLGVLEMLSNHPRFNPF